MNTYGFFDTSAIIDGQLETERYNLTHCYVSRFSLRELESIKLSFNKDESVKRKAAKAARYILNNPNSVSVTKNSVVSDKDIQKQLKKHKLMETPDNFIIMDIVLTIESMTTEEKDLTFFSGDVNQLHAMRDVLEGTINYHYTGVPKEAIPVYNGWEDYSPSENDIASLYSNPSENVLGCNVNQYAKIIENGEIKDILFWDGNKYRPLKYKSFVTQLGEKIVPRNLEQKMYLDLLQNHDIGIKVCIGKFGTGKSYLALAYALEEVHKGRFDKIIFVKNNLEVKGAGKLGILPGDELQKQYPWLKQIEDHIGIDLFNEYLEEGKLEPAHLSGLRGRDFKNAIILVDEAENLMKTNIQLLLGRVGQNTEIIFCGDFKQTDYRKESDSGLEFAIHRLKQSNKFGIVRLVKTERSEIAATADLLD